jgi:hypothetical protein
MYWFDCKEARAMMMNPAPTRQTSRAFSSDEGIVNDACLISSINSFEFKSSKL